MKRTFLMIVSVFLVVLLFAGCACEHTYVSEVVKEPTYEEEGTLQYTCSNCGETYTEAIPMLEKHVVPTWVLDDALSNVTYRYSMFSISVGELVNQAVKNYKITYYTGEEAIRKGLVKKSEIGSSVDIDFLYYAVISGDVMMNPQIPYMTQYDEKAVIAWMIFNENDQLLNSGVTLCKNLQTCALMLMC